MNESRSEKLLNKVYDHLEKIDVSGLSMRELQDFLEVVQKGRFLETLGQPSPYSYPGFGGFAGGAFTKPPVSGGDEKPGDNGND